MSAQELGTTDAARRGRPHTGRARNERVRQAILSSTIALLSKPDSGGVTIEAIARHAAVGKQTIYRWWPNKSGLVIEAITSEARDAVRDIDSGDVRRDLEHFLSRTFGVVKTRTVSQALRAMMADALCGDEGVEVLRGYAAERRAALAKILSRGVSRGELDANADVDCAVEQAFGFIWYRLILGDEPLTRSAAMQLARALLRQLGHR